MIMGAGLSRGPCYLLNRDTESWQGRVAQEHVVLSPLGELGQPGRVGVSPSRAKVLQERYSAIFLQGYEATLGTSVFGSVCSFLLKSVW